MRLRPGSTERIASLVAGAKPAGPTGAGARAQALADEGWDFYSKGDVEHARDRLAEAVATGAAPVWASYALGYAEFALAHYAAAAAAWETVRGSQPAFEPAYFDLADAYTSLGQLGDAVAVLRDTARRWPNDPQSHNALGVTLTRRGALDEAIDEFRQATTVAPDDGLGYFNLGRAYHLRYARLLQHASSAGLGGTSLGAADRQKAIDAYTRYLQIGGPFEKDARDAIGMLQWK